DLHAKWHGAENGRVTVAVAAYAPDMVSPALLQGLRDLREKLDTIATVQIGTARQVAWRGKRPRHGRGCSLRSRHGFPGALTRVARLARKTRHHRHRSDRNCTPSGMARKTAASRSRLQPTLQTWFPRRSYKGCATCEKNSTPSPPF